MSEKLTDEQIVSLVNAEFDEALGASDGEISLERAKAWGYYLRKPFGDEEEGSSQVVTSDVADVVDGIMPSLLRLFTTADNLVSFDAVGPEDEERAQQESDYVNYVFFKRNPSFEILFFWMFDALVQKNGIVKAWWDESEEVTEEAYEGLSNDDLLELLDDDELEPIEQDEREAETVDPQTGEIVRAIVHDVRFRRVSKGGRVRIECVPPEEYRISADARSLDPSKARMVGHEREVTRDELIAMGFDRELVESLPAEDDVIDTPEKEARRDKSDDIRVSTKARDKSQDRIRLREAYIKVDADGDGRSELLQVFTAGDRLLSKEPVDRQPFHVICPHPLPHKHFGLSTAEKVMDIQRVNSALLRQTLDNLYHTNRPGHAVWEHGMTENTMDDLLTTRVGRVARFARPVNESYAPMTVPFTAGASFPMLEYFDKLKRDRTGISSDSQGLSPEALKNIQTTVLAQATDLSKMKIEAIARIFAETGIKSLFLHIHELLLKHQEKAELVKLRGVWVPVNPQEWRTRRDMTVNIGLGIGTREQNLVHLNAIWEKQAQMVQAGGMNLTVTPRNIYNTAAEIVKNANLKNPAMFFTDPGDQRAPPPPDEQIQLQQQAMQLEERRQQLDARRQELDVMEREIERQRMTLEHERGMAEIFRKMQKDQADFQVAMDQVMTKLTDLELKYGANVPGSAV